MNYVPHHNLDTFRILFIVKGILTLLLSLLALIYVFVGSFLFSNFHEFNTVDDQFPFPFNPGVFMAVFGGAGFVFLVTLGILTLFAAKYIKEQRQYNFIFVVAILNCFTGMLGILLGVFTIVELTKPHVKELFNKS